MAENSSDSDSSVDGDDTEPNSESGDIPDAFLVSLEAIEDNGLEFDAELMNAITEVEGTTSFPCDQCVKICKSKGGLTRHRRSKHEPDVNAEEGQATSKTATSKSRKPNRTFIAMSEIERLCKEIAETLREEKLYPENILKIVEGLKPSESFVKFVSESFSKFKRKCNQDVFLAKFYGDIYKNWKAYFPACDKQIAVNVLLIHFPQKLIVYHKQSGYTAAGEVEETGEFTVNPEELGPLSYIAGYVLQSMYKKSKNSPHWNSQRSLELQGLLKSIRLKDDEQDEYISSLSRGGLWAPNENIKGIAESAEVTFRRYLPKGKTVTKSIPTDKVVDEVLMQPLVLSLWENITTGLDVSVSSECSKLALENFVKLFIRVRSFSHAKDIVSQFKIKQKQPKTKALRTELKKKGEQK